MDALYSGFSYASNEIRRAAKPVIDTLAPVLPTFGFGAVAVKQSVSSCIHEMEAAAINAHHEYERNMAWSNVFSSVKRIILYPLMDPAATFSSQEKCRDSTQQEMAVIANVTGNINEQLEIWHIPFRFEISDLYMSKADVLKKQSNNCLSSAPNKEKMALAFAHCDSPQANGKPAGGYQGACHIVFGIHQGRMMIAHELAHVFSPHTFDAVPLASLHPDVLEAMCDPGVHGHELITSLSYWNHCRDAGFPDAVTHVKDSRGQWGPIDLTMAKLATHKQRDAIHAQIHAEGVDQCYEWIRQNYGPRIAEQFMGSFVKSVFIHSMSAIAVRSIEDKRLLRLSRVLIHTFGNLIQLGMLGQPGLSAWSIAHQIAGMGLMGQTVRAIIDVMGDAALMRAFVQLLRGNGDAMLQMVYATCGTTAGNAFSQIIHSFIDMCAPTSSTQRNNYLDMTRPTGMWGMVMDEIGTSIVGDSLQSNVEKTIARLPTAIRTIITIDRSVAEVISNYVSLQAMTSWLWKTDQQKADAQVQARIDKLTITLDEVKSKFGASDLPRAPSNTRSFRPNQPVPSLDLDRVADDDPLLSMDGAAFAGIGNTSLAKNKQALHPKKQQ